MNKEHKISQYADDTSLTLNGSPSSLFAALDTLNFFFSKTSGLNINFSKQKLYGLVQKSSQAKCSIIQDGS